MRNAIVNFILVAICVAFGLPWLISFLLPSTPSSSESAVVLRQLERLSQQLFDVEALNSNYKNELASLKRELEVFVVVQGESNEQPVPAAITSYLPHLAKNVEALKPAIHLASPKAVHFVIGIMAKKRKDDHLVDTLRSLTSGLSESDAKNTVIVLMVTENDEEFVETLVKSINEKLQSAVTRGLIEVVSPKSDFYPNITSLKSTFGDSPEEVQLRAKQVLDVSFLMLFCQRRAKFHLFLSDEMTTKEGFMGDIRKFILDQHSNEWLSLDFAPNVPGLEGNLFRSKDIYALTEFFLMFYRDKPIKWLLEDFLLVKYCHPEMTSDACNAEKNAARRPYRPALFSQIGVTVPPFVTNTMRRLYIPHENPHAVATTSLTHYEDYKIDAAYAGENFFWAMEPKPNDTVTIELSPPVKLKEYTFRSGNADHIDDRFYETVVEIKFDTDGPLSADMFDPTAGIQVIPGYEYAIVGQFDINGICEGNLPTTWPVSVVRLRCKEKSNFWVLLSEIHLVQV